MPDKLTIPKVLDRFAAYKTKNPAWGSLHVVLDDGNVDSTSVQFCKEYALEKADADGAELADLLLRMSKTQRRKLAVIL